MKKADGDEQCGWCAWWRWIFTFFCPGHQKLDVSWSKKSCEFYSIRATCNILIAWCQIPYSDAVSSEDAWLAHVAHHFMNYVSIKLDSPIKNCCLMIKLAKEITHCDNVSLQRTSDASRLSPAFELRNKQVWQLTFFTIGAQSTKGASLFFRPEKSVETRHAAPCFLLAAFTETRSLFHSLNE